MKLSRTTVGALLSAGALVAAGCSGSDREEGADSARVVMLGSDNETLDYASAQSYFPWVVIQNVCDSLVTLDEGDTRLVLAEEIAPNDDATEWTITLRAEAAFHNGDPVTASDVAASLAYFARSPGFMARYAAVDLEAATVVDEHTLTVPLHTPRWDFVDTVLASASVVYEGGEGETDTPSCSGPFLLESYSADTGAMLARHDDYWGTPAQLERIEVAKLNDPAARVNALMSGEADVAFDLPSSQAQTIAGTSGLQLLEGGVADSGAYYFALNTRVAPLDNPEVRRALRLAVDRDQMVEVVLGDYGEVGNDLFGRGWPGYLDGLEQRDRDVDEARDVLQDSEVTELTVLVSEGAPGLTASAELLVQQLAEVDVTVTLDEVDPSNFFTDLDRLHEAQVIAWYAANQGPLAGLETWYGADNPFAQTGWDPPELIEFIDRARGNAEETERSEALTELQRLQWAEGSYLIWGFRSHLSGAVDDLDGVVLNQGVPLFGAATRA